MRNMDYLQEISTLLVWNWDGTWRWSWWQKMIIYDHDDHDVLHKSLIKSLIFIFFGEFGPRVAGYFPFPAAPPESSFRLRMMSESSRNPTLSVVCIHPFWRGGWKMIFFLSERWYLQVQNGFFLGYGYWIFGPEVWFWLSFFWLICKMIECKS